MLIKSVEETPDKSTVTRNNSIVKYVVMYIFLNIILSIVLAMALIISVFCLSRKKCSVEPSSAFQQDRRLVENRIDPLERSLEDWAHLLVKKAKQQDSVIYSKEEIVEKVFEVANLINSKKCRNLR
jgi:hypothetical protein